MMNITNLVASKRVRGWRLFVLWQLVYSWFSALWFKTPLEIHFLWLTSCVATSLTYWMKLGVRKCQFQIEKSISANVLNFNEGLSKPRMVKGFLRVNLGIVFEYSWNPFPALFATHSSIQFYSKVRLVLTLLWPEQSFQHTLWRWSKNQNTEICGKYLRFEVDFRETSFFFAILNLSFHCHCQVPSIFFFFTFTQRVFVSLKIPNLIHCTVNRANQTKPFR